MKDWLKIGLLLLCCLHTAALANEEDEKSESGNEKSQWTDYQKAKEIIKKHQESINKKSTDEKTGFLVGTSLGGGLPYSNSTTGSSDSISSFAATAGLMGGYQKFLSPQSGFRAYLNVNSGNGFASSKGANAELATQTFILVGLNIDAMVGMSIGEDKTSSLGLIGGLGYAVLMYKDNFSGQDGIKTGPLINAGVFLSVGKHRFEVLAKILPIDYTNVQTDAGANTSFTNVLGTLGYSYVF